MYINDEYEEQGGEAAAQPAADAIERYGQADMSRILEGKGDNPRGNIWYLPIIGHIEGHMVMPPANKTTKYEHLIPMLLNVAERQEIDGLLVVLNTVGGDVEAGLAIAELISHFSKPTVSLVLGGGHSIGVPLAVAAKFSYIAASAAMTIHPVRMSGTLVGAPQTYDYFDKMQERVLEFIVANADISKQRLRELMLDTSTLALDVGTFLIGEECVKERLIDAVGGLDDAMEKLYQMIAEIRQAHN
ncbi:MAG: ATP-dependent Clp protease proteolytic subunit [Clostridiales bacterium]|jgi:ATP-dependent protease ClpP protease subunit|nr:ATP-dependent Clp protease proteolytic subunit [Clostridiales bacterium]